MKTKRDDRDSVRSATVAFSITPPEKKRIQELADQYGITVSTLLRIITDAFLSRGKHND